MSLGEPSKQCCSLFGVVAFAHDEDGIRLERSSASGAMYQVIRFETAKSCGFNWVGSGH